MIEQEEMLEHGTIWECSRNFWEPRLDAGPKSIESWVREGRILLHTW